MQIRLSYTQKRETAWEEGASTERSMGMKLASKLGTHDATASF